MSVAVKVGSRRGRVVHSLAGRLNDQNGQNDRDYFPPPPFTFSASHRISIPTPFRAFSFHS